LKAGWEAPNVQANEAPSLFCCIQITVHCRFSPPSSPIRYGSDSLFRLPGFPMVQNLDFQPYSDRLPPQNVEAEEAILGGVLLDPEAIGRVMEVLNPDAFYISAHKLIYQAAVDLNAKGQPTDLMSVTAWLKDRDLLEKMGGQSRLAQLVDRTLSAANIDQYATLVMDKFMRRRLIHIGGEISQLGFETSAPLEQSLDQAEQRLFAITQDRPQQALTSTADILIDTFSDIEQRSLGMILPGIPLWVL
jgi:replicative DNA helicase